MALSLWLAEDLGIDPEEPPTVAENRLRTALRGAADDRQPAAVYGIRIDTDHTVPETVIRAALRDLAHRLGPGTGISLVADDGDGNDDGNDGVLDRIGQCPFPVTGH